MKYAGIIEDDFVNGEGVCVSFWAQGCPHRCPGCHNPQTWNKNCGLEEDPDELISRIVTAISKNGIERNLSLLGGEPLVNYNVEFISKLVSIVREIYPKIKIYVWTGYEFEELLERVSNGEKELENILKNTYMIATGPFKKELRDVSLKFVGSSNQKVIYLNN